MVGVPIITVADEARTWASLRPASPARSFSTRYRLAPKARGRKISRQATSNAIVEQANTMSFGPSCQVLTNRQHSIDETSVGDTYPFRFPGRTGGVDHISQAIFGNCTYFIIGRTIPGAEVVQINVVLVTAGRRPGQSIFCG